MANQPTFLFIHNFGTFRRLLSRQLTEQNIAQEAAEDARPITTRPNLADSNAAAPLPEETPAGG